MINESLEWWNSMPFETQFFKTIEHNKVIKGDHTKNPKNLTNDEIENIYKSEFKL